MSEQEHYQAFTRELYPSAYSKRNTEQGTFEIHAAGLVNIMKTLGVRPTPIAPKGGEDHGT